jgi:hypothetical protein
MQEIASRAGEQGGQEERVLVAAMNYRYDCTRHECTACFELSKEETPVQSFDNSEKGHTVI